MANHQVPGRSRNRLITVVLVLGLLGALLPMGGATLAAEHDGAAYVPLSPARVLDTRDDVPIGQRDTLTAPVTGLGGVPADGVAAVAVNITAVTPTRDGYLTVYPSGQVRPFASSINFKAGDIVGNFVIAEVGADGTVDIYNHNGQVDVVFDVVGYFPTAVDPGDVTNQTTVRLNWQNVYDADQGVWGAVDDYAAYNLDNDGAGEVTLRWNTETGRVVTEGQTALTAPIPVGGFQLRSGALDAVGPVAIPLPTPTLLETSAAQPGGRGDYSYSLDGQVVSPAYTSTLAALDAALAGDGVVDWYLQVTTADNPAGELRGQLGDDAIVDGGLHAIVPLYEFVEFHELGEGTNTGEDQTSFNLLFDADIDFAGVTGQQRPQPEDFVMIRDRGGSIAELEILRVRGNNPDWQPYPKPDIRIHLDTHDVIEDGDLVTVTILDSGVQKLLPYGRNSAADDLSDSWRTRCTHVISVVAMTSEPCGTPPRAGLSGYTATAIDSAPNQEQQFSVTIEEPGLPAGEELWIDLIDVSFDGLVDYSESVWTATVDGTTLGTAEFWEYEEVERFQTIWEPFIVFTHDEDDAVAGELVLSGTDIDGSDAAVFGEDTAYDSYVVRHDTGRADYTEIEVVHVPQPLITLHPADAVVLAEAGATLEATATYTDTAGVPVGGAEIRFWAEQGERPDIVQVPLGTATTSAEGIATITYDYDGRSVELGEPLIDTLRAELVDDRFVDARTTVTWATGVATNEGPGEAEGATYHDLNDAIVDAEAGDTITAVGAFTSVYGLPRGDRVHITKQNLTLQAGAGGASLLGALDVRASGATVDGFSVVHAGSMEYAFRVEGAAITISNNAIDAAGADGFRVRDAWRVVTGGGSAAIVDNTISNAAIAIDVDNRDQASELVVDLTIEGNLFEDNDVGIHYNPDAGSPSISGNEFEASDASIVYVRDATASEALDLEATLAANSYDPEGEILGRSIVPIDPTHVPSIVRVVEHGTGQGKQYTVIEYTRGVACDADGAEVGSQFRLDRGTAQTPNRTGVAVDCDHGPAQILITWDGNPSFPNEITYVQHDDPAYRIHNEHPLADGGFTSALSPDLVGSPFPKPPEDAPVSGAVHFTSGDDTIDGRSFEQGAMVDDIDLRVRISDRSEPASLELWFDGARPSEGFTAGEDICADLLAEASCTTIQQALAGTNPFTGDTTFLDGVTLELASDAVPGEWQLRWWVVDAVTSEAYFADTFAITIEASD